MDIERIRSLVRELAVETGILLDESGTDDLVPLRWFSRFTLVSADQLRGARRREAIRCEQRGSRWFYSKMDVRRLFPDYWLGPGGSGKSVKRG